MHKKKSKSTCQVAKRVSLRRERKRHEVARKRIFAHQLNEFRQFFCIEAARGTIISGVTKKDVRRIVRAERFEREAKIESELAELPEADRNEMLESMGMKEPALNAVIEPACSTPAFTLVAPV